MRNVAIAFCVVLTIIGFNLAHAQSGCAATSCVRLPVILKMEAPKPTPAPSNRVIVISSSAFTPYVGSDHLYLVGEMRNETTSKVRFVKINAVLRDAAGQIVDGTYSYASVGTLTPNMTSGFRLIFSKPPAWATYEFTVTWDTTTHIPYALQILSPESYFDSSNAYHVRGTVKNQDAVEHTFVEVFLIMYDSNNQVIGVESTFMNPTTLTAGQEVPFDISAYFWKGKPDHSQVTRYSIQAIDD